MKYLKWGIVWALVLLGLAFIIIEIRSQLTYAPPTDFNPNKPPVKALP